MSRRAGLGLGRGGEPAWETTERSEASNAILMALHTLLVSSTLISVTLPLGLRVVKHCTDGCFYFSFLLFCAALFLFVVVVQAFVLVQGAQDGTSFSSFPPNEQLLVLQNPS